jgi:glyoxylase-like metal-dependent hydrolase (beta-lactamase superfamily II)
MLSANPYGDVLQIRLSRYPDFPASMWVAAYLVDGLLIDTGPSWTAGELTAFLDDKRPALAVNTHYHEDHISANKFLQDAYGILIYAPPASVAKIASPAKLYPYQEEVWGYPVPSTVEPLGGYIETGKYRFAVIPTPGHDRDHVCLFEEANGWLFTGDLYVTTKPVVCRPNDDMRQTLEDIKKLRALNPSVIFPAPTHVVKEPLPKLDSLIAYLEDLGGKIESLHSRGMEAEQIRQELLGPEGPIDELTQHQFSSLNLVKSFLGMHGAV